MTEIQYGTSPADPSGSAASFHSVLRSLDRDGGSTLSELDLITVILGPARSGRSRETARRILDSVGWRGLLLRGGRGWREGLGRVQAARLGAALELGRRMAGGDPGYLPGIRSPEDVWEATADVRAARREHFLGLYLNARHRLLARETISVGSLNASIVHPREVFEPALRHAAAGLIVVHNHPSGETDPSRDDLSITRRLVEAGEILGVPLLDHVIVGTRGFTSLKEAGHL